MPQYTDGIRQEVFEWQRIDAPDARDISVAADMTPWIVTTEAVEGGFRVRRREGATWVDAGVGGVAVECAPDGVAWVIDDTGRLLQEADGWRPVDAPGRVLDCGAGLDAVVWAVIQPSDGTAAVLQLIDGAWTSDIHPRRVNYPNAAPWTAADDGEYGGAHGDARPSDPRSVAVMADNLPWVVDADGTHYRRVPEGWQVMPTEHARDIDISIGGNVWIVGTDDRGAGFGPWRYYHGTDWDAHDGAAERIAVGRDGLPWIVDRIGRIHRHHVKL